MNEPGCKCKEGYWEDVANESCTKCPAECKACEDGSGKCTLCIDSLAMDINNLGTCGCGSISYLDTDSKC